MIRPVIPHAGEDVKKILVGVTNPQARFRRKPIELPQPPNGWLKAFILHHLRLGWAFFALGLNLPFVTGPFPDAAVVFAFGLQPELKAVAV